MHRAPPPSASATAVLPPLELQLPARRAPRARRRLTVRSQDYASRRAQLGGAVLCKGGRRSRLGAPGRVGIAARDPGGGA